MESGDPPSGWSAYLGATLSSVSDERTGGSGSKSMNATGGGSSIKALQSIGSASVGNLYKVTAWGKSIVAGTFVRATYDNSAKYVSVLTTTSTSWVSDTMYVTAHGSGTVLGISLLSASQSRFDDISVKQVTALGTDALQLRNASTGTTRNFTSIDAGFDPNAIRLIKVSP